MTQPTDGESMSIVMDLLETTQIWVPIGNGIRGAAGFSADGRYRYWLGRQWDADLPMIGFGGLNPSTAHGAKDDATSRRWIGFATSWGYGGYYAWNLYAFVATKPKELYACDDPVGPLNDETIIRVVDVCIQTVCCWGAHPMARQRVAAVRKILSGRELYCLGRTKDGSPAHPLFLKGDTTLEAF